DDGMPPATEDDNPQQSPSSEPVTINDDAPEGTAGHIWYYVSTENAGVVSNILADVEELPIINGVDLNLGTAPWSPDGRQVAQISRGEVLFYELGDEAVVTGSYAAAQYKTVRAWI